MSPSTRVRASAVGSGTHAPWSRKSRAATGGARGRVPEHQAHHGTQGVNAFSGEWYATFLESLPAGITATEIAFVERQLPRAGFPSLLDLCCGPGRHAGELSRRGYD